jgi:uncharacterized membrane protein YedE/YeeE
MSHNLIRISVFAIAVEIVIYALLNPLQVFDALLYVSILGVLLIFALLIASVPIGFLIGAIRITAPRAARPVRPAPPPEEQTTEEIRRTPPETR